MEYGYVRISSRDQNDARQIKAMKDHKIKHVYKDKMSGKDFNRPQYKKLIKKLQENDILYILSIDRLGRNYEEILEQWRYITKDIKANIVVLDMPLLDTRMTKNTLLSTFISDMVLQILSYVAQTERELILTRQREGLDIAKKRGVRMGRKFKPIPEDYEDVLQKWQDGVLSEVKAAQALGVAPATFRVWRKRPLAELIQQRAGWTVTE